MMWRILLLTVVLLNVVSGENGKDERELSPVISRAIIELTANDFKEAVEKFHFLCVCFYSKLSKASKDFEPIYEELRETMLKENKDIIFARIEMSAHPEVELHVSVIEIPTIKLFKMGRHYDFRGQKTVKHMKTWMHLAMNIPVIISSANEMEDLKKRGTVIVGCFPGNSPAADYESFKSVSANFVSGKHIPLPRFSLITKASVSREVGILKGTVVIYKSFEDGAKVVYDGKISDSEKLLAFCEEEAQPVVFPYGNEELAFKMSGGGIKLQHLLFMSSKDSRFGKVFANFKAAAREFRKSIDEIGVLFVFADVSKDHIERVVSYFHVDPKTDVPCNRMTQIDKYHSRFVPEKMDLTKEGFIDFTKQVIDGKVERSVRTEALPADWDKYPLKVLVGSNYEEICQTKGKSVFVMYYVKDHKESEEMMPVVDALALEFKLNNTVVIASMDVSKNDGEVDVHHSYPSFKLFTKENKELKFSGQKTANAMKAFINSDGQTHIGYIPPAEDTAESAIEYIGKLTEEQHPLKYEDEEERQRLWTLEEQEILKNAVVFQDGKSAHDDPEHLVNPDHHDMEAKGIVTDHKDMDPKQHAMAGAGETEEYIHDHHQSEQTEYKTHTLEL